MNDKTRKPVNLDLIRSSAPAADREGARRKGRADILDQAATAATGAELVVFASLDEWGCAAMAAAWFTMLADARKVRAVVAGARLPARLQAHVAAAMQESGAALTSVHTTSLTTALLRQADLVVTMAGTFARGSLMTRSQIEPVRREHWMVQPETTESDVADIATRTRSLRDIIRCRVAMLVFTEGWERADLSREMSRVTRPRWHNVATV